MQRRKEDDFSGGLYVEMFRLSKGNAISFMDKHISDEIYSFH